MSLASSQGRNLRFMALAMTGIRIFAFALGIAVPLIFQQEAYGKLAFINAAVFPVTLLGANWLNPVMNRELNQEPGATAEILWTNLVLKGVFTGSIATVATVVAHFLLDDPAMMWIFFAVLAGNIALALGIAEAYDARRRSSYDFALRLVIQFAHLLLVLWLLFGGVIPTTDDAADLGRYIWMIAGAEALRAIAVTALGLWLFHRKIRKIPFTFSRQRARRQIGFSKELILSGFSDKLPGNLDTFLLGIFGGYGWSGVYSVAQKLLANVREFTKLSFRLFLPELIRTCKHDRERFARIYQFGSHVIGGLCLGIASVCIGLHSEIIGGLFPGYEAAALPFAWISLAFCCRHLAKINNATMIAAGLTTAYARTQYLMAGSSLLAMSVLIPARQVTGAAMSMALAYFVSWLSGWTAVRHLVPAESRPRWSRLMLPALLTVGVTLFVLKELTPHLTGVLVSLRSGIDGVIVAVGSRVGAGAEASRDYFVGLASAVVMSGAVAGIYAISLWVAGPFSREHKQWIRKIFTGTFKPKSAWAEA